MTRAELCEKACEGITVGGLWRIVDQPDDAARLIGLAGAALGRFQKVADPNRVARVLREIGTRLVMEHTQ